MRGLDIPMEVRPIPAPSGDDVARFWALVDQSGDCWEWQGLLAPNGYGLFCYRGSKYVASRVVWRITHGDPGQIYVCHRCDNPRCVNPEHLFLGSFQDNMDDRNAKDRTAKGEAHGRVRLTQHLVLQLLAMHRLGLRGRDLAVLFGLSRQQVSRILRGDRWAHLRAGDPSDRRLTLSDAKVAQIRLLKLSGVKRGAIALRMGVTPEQVEKVCSYRSRKHIRPEVGVPA